jgi:hypothetical protein
MTVVEYWNLLGALLLAFLHPISRMPGMKWRGGGGEGGLDFLPCSNPNKQVGGWETIKFLISQRGVSNNSLLYSLPGV